MVSSFRRSRTVRSAHTAGNGPETGTSVGGHSGLVCGCHADSPPRADCSSTHFAVPPSPIDEIPLIVLTRGSSDTSQQEYAAHNKLQQELADLSTNGKQLIAADSGHHIYADQPELVIESVKELILLVRDGGA